MNAIPSHHPRLVCRIARFSRDIVDTSASSHVASCPDCQAFLATSSQLENALRHEATRSIPEPRAGLDQRIIHAVRRSAEDSANTNRASSRSPALLWAGIACVSAVVFALIIFPASRPAFSGGRTVALTQTDAKAVADAVKTLSNEFVETVIPSAGAIVANNPLQQELDSIYSDARSALGFLKLNFLPSSGDNPLPRSG
jgi:hypothetical protein